MKLDLTDRIFKRDKALDTFNGIPELLILELEPLDDRLLKSCFFRSLKVSRISFEDRILICFECGSDRFQRLILKIAWESGQLE